MKRKIALYSSLIAMLTSLLAVAHAQTFTVIHAFNGQDGSRPAGGVTLRNGVLYGTTQGGGSTGGVAFAMKRSVDNWGFSLISTFSDGGHNPASRLVFGPDGHPYGTTLYDNGGPPGGSNSGLVYDLVPPITICKTANCFWKENVLYQFQDSPDGAFPLIGDLVWDQKGNAYGTTTGGGVSGFGTVYELTCLGGNCAEKVLHSFSHTDGWDLEDGVILDGTGNVYGTAAYGGAYGGGVVFELKFSNGSWTETNLYDFRGGSDGGSVRAGLIFDRSSNLYGATNAGGSNGQGTVFELSPSGDTWTFKLLYSFPWQNNGSCGPNASLTMDSVGNIYGTTQCGGVNNKGNIFKLTSMGDSWVYTSLYDFRGDTDGSSPSRVAIDADGTLYGTAGFGGEDSMGPGTVWMFKP